MPTSLDDQPPTPPSTSEVPSAPRAERVSAVTAPDAVCAAAVGMALAAAVEVAEPGTVGDHLGVHAEAERVVTHHFASVAKGYRGWRWAVTVARASRSRTATVCEVVLLPGADAVLAPQWLPWSQRLAPGDLGAADQLPYRADDPYLEPGYTQTGLDELDPEHQALDDDADRVARWELGLGRPRVLSPAGRAAAVERWYLGDRGPTSDEAVHARGACSGCGYFLALGGSLRRVFGVCANEWSPSDGKVVSVDHGCGAHSETDVEHFEPLPLPMPILDETRADSLVLMPREPETVAPVEPAPAEASGTDSGDRAESASGDGSTETVD